MARSEAVKKSAENKIGKGAPGPGRPKGMPNKTTSLLKDAILKAAEQAGGREGLTGYLKKQAEENPGPFMSLLGKVLPLQVQGAVGLTVSVVDNFGKPDDHDPA